MRINNDLTRATRHQAFATPEDWESVYRQMALDGLADDIEVGFLLAYCRNFAVPSIAATLCHNGEIIERPMNRSYNTAIVTYELIASGLGSCRGRHIPGSQNDFLYVLLTQLVVPIRWARASTWRAPRLADETAATRFYRELRSRMNITGFPATFEAAEQFFDNYEHDNIANSPAGAQFMASTVQFLKFRLHSFARPLTTTLLSTTFDEERPIAALTLPRVTQLSKGILNVAAHTRKTIRRHCAPRMAYLCLNAG